MVARLTPDQKVACSNHVGVISFFFFLHFLIFCWKKKFTVVYSILSCADCAMKLVLKGACCIRLNYINSPAMNRLTPWRV